MPVALSLHYTKNNYVSPPHAGGVKFLPAPSVFIMIKIVSVIVVVVALAYLVTLGNDGIKGDRQNLTLEDCQIKSSGFITYKTAAGFDMKVPDWRLGGNLADHYTSECKLKSAHFSFGLYDGIVKLIPNGGIKVEGYNEENIYEQHITLMMNFENIKDDSFRYQDIENHCFNKRHRDINRLNVRVCSRYSDIESESLSEYHPRFELIDDKKAPTSFRCLPRDTKGYSLENIEGFTTQYTCRGYWRWRLGATAMFDLHNGRVLDSAYILVSESEKILYSWIVESNRNLTKKSR